MIKMLNLKSYLRKKIKREQPNINANINTEDDLLLTHFWAEDQNIIMSIPPEKLVMQGALNFNSKHPFIEALESNINALHDFYDRVQPDNLAAYYNLEISGRAGELLPPWEIPWYNRKKRNPPPGENGLDASEGYSFYGPVTKRKLKVEMMRLENIRQSINRSGFNPDIHGYPEGYILSSHGHTAFFIRGGKHRVAVLTQLGYEKIPVRFKVGFPRLIEASLTPYFPLVHSGAMASSVARDILTKYVIQSN